MCVRYVIVTPARNEGRAIEETIVSIIHQTVLPLEWVIVDDGSEDESVEILDRYARKYSWITVVHRRNRGFRQPGRGVVEAFDDGYRSVKNHNWEYVVKLDADLVLEQDYFERCLKEFELDSNIGIAGGTVYELQNGQPKMEPIPPFHVRGATKIYRRACWDQLGGLVPAPGWDTLDEVKANMLGWHTRSFSHIRVLQRRATGSNDGVWRDYVKNGRANYVAGYHPLFLFLKCIRRLVRPPYVIGSFGLAFGFAAAYLRRLPQVDDPELIHYLRGEQRRMMLGKASLWS
jgi:biofilm PGA synthesis N-glycosyltransferase PgaC